MKAENVPLVVALIAASASLGAVLYNQYSAGRLERNKWEQARQDSLRAVVVDFAKELTAAHQRAEWMVWRATYAGRTLTQSDFDTFHGEAKLSLPKLFGYRVLLTAKRPDAYQALGKVVSGFYAADECVGLARAEFRKDQTKGIRALSECGRTFKLVSEALVPAFTAAMNATDLVESVCN